jgi:drug/metabolite transporter (DMT)-like permease
MIWAVALGWFLFGDIPQQVVLTGAAVVIAAGIFVIWREKQLGMLKSVNREAGTSISK